MLIDTHIHVGQFYNTYFTPYTIHKLIIQLNVDYYAVSSTTQCEEDYVKVLSELEELIIIDGKKVLPIMWITPKALLGNIAWFLESEIQWRCLKIHPFLHQNDWDPKGKQIEEVIDIARELHLPLLIHTGIDACCQCGKYESLIAHNRDIKFILAHGRPLTQITPLLRDYPNAYADSAFMPISDMALLMKKNLSHKLLWGTDMCIPKYFYPNENMQAYYKKKLEAFKRVSTQEQYEQVTSMNAVKLFKIQNSH